MGAKNASSISSAIVREVHRMERAQILASFHARAPEAVGASQHSAHRTPGILFAAIETPVPVQQHTIPRTVVSGAEAATTALPTARPTCAQGLHVFSSFGCSKAPRRRS